MGRASSLVVAFLIAFSLLMPRIVVLTHAHEGGSAPHHNHGALPAGAHHHPHPQDGQPNAPPAGNEFETDRAAEGADDSDDGGADDSEDNEEHSHTLAIGAWASAVRGPYQRISAANALDARLASPLWTWVAASDTVSAARPTASILKHGHSPRHCRSTTERLVQGLGLLI